jgi:endonuclease/exonuclease/phosphatase family metal-dependent hydrolase
MSRNGIDKILQFKYNENMKIKLLTWNVNYWQNYHKEELRDYLNKYDADFILLQEAKPCIYLSSNYSDEYLNGTRIPYNNKDISYDLVFKNHEIHYHQIPYDQVEPYGSMIISGKHSSIKNYFMPEHYYRPGATLYGSTLLCYDYKVENKIITLINIYRSPRLDVNKIHFMINDIESITKNYDDNHLIILAGDFNISDQPTYDFPNGYPNADKIFERIHGLGFINCTMEKYGKHIQTINKADYQNDYIFINKPYKKRQDNIDCKESPLSDHYQLELEYNL